MFHDHEPQGHGHEVQATGPVEEVRPLHLVAEHEDVVGAAVDILSMRHRVPREEAEDLLLQTVADRNRPVEEVAEDVVLIALPTLPTQIELRPAQPGDPTVLVALLDLLAESSNVREVGQGIVDLAVELCPEVAAASLTLIREGVPGTVAATDRAARE